MKHAIINFFFLTALILFTVVVSFMTPISTIEKDVEPPVKSQRHLYLENKEFLALEEMDELQQEIYLFEKRWSEKSADEQISPMEGLSIVRDRLQPPLIVVMTLFFLFTKVRSLLEPASSLLALVVLTFILPVLSLKTTIYGVILVVSTAYVKRLRKKGTD